MEGDPGEQNFQQSLREKQDNIDSLEEIYATRCFNWLEKLAETIVCLPQYQILVSPACYLALGVLVANK